MTRVGGGGQVGTGGQVGGSAACSVEVLVHRPRATKSQSHLLVTNARRAQTWPRLPGIQAPGPPQTALVAADTPPAAHKMDGPLHSASATTTATLHDDMEADIIHIDSGQQPPLRKRSLAHRLGITGKMAVLVGFLTLFSVGVLAIVAWVDSSALLEYQLQQRLNTIALLQSRQLTNFFTNLAENTQLISNRVLLQSYLRQVHTTGAPLSAFQNENGTVDLASAVFSLTDVVAVTIYNANGSSIIFQVNNTPIDEAIFNGLKPSLPLGNLSTLNSNVPGLQVIPPNSRFSSDLGYLWSVSASVLDNHDLKSPPIGFITMILSSEGISHIVSDNSGLGQSGQLLVAHHYNTTHYRFVLPPIYGSTGFDQPLPLDDFDAMRLALSNASGTIEGSSFDGDQVLAAYQPVGFAQWGLVAEMSVSEIYSPIATLRIIIIAATLGTLAFTIVATVLFSRVFTAPINQLVNVSNAFREGDLGARAPPSKSAKWWPDQLSDLQVVFNAMADRIGGQYIWLEQTVLERTQELREASRAADAANAAKSRFLANMSHEIRTPLNAIVNISRLCLEDEEGVQGDSRQLLQLLRASGDHLLTLVDAVLETSRIEAGMAEPASRPFRLRRIINQLRSMFYVSTKQKGIEFTCTVEADVPDNLKGDSQWLMQVLVNLVGNAVKFTSEGGVTVNIRITQWSPPPPPPVSNTTTANTTTTAFSVPSTLPPDDSSSKTMAASPMMVIPAAIPGEEMVMLQFSISDTGIGIPDDRQHLLFKSFSQIDSTHSRKFGGSGLGLAISKQLVELMGGKMWLESGSGGKGESGDKGVNGDGDGNDDDDGDGGDKVKSGDGNGNGNGNGGGMAQTPIPASTPVSHWTSNPSQAQVQARAQAQAQAQIPTPTPTPTHSQTPTLTPTLTPTPTPTHSQTQPQTQTQTPTPTQSPTPAQSLTRSQVRIQTPPPAQSQVRIQTPPPTASQTRKKAQQGATFFFCVPFATVGDSELKRQESEERMLSAKSEPDRQLHILMAEDNTINQEIARRILTKMGHTVVLAGNGFEALEEFQRSVEVAKDGVDKEGENRVRERFDIILMDVQMPELDGIAATERIRAYEAEHALAPIPIIALTAHALSSDQEVCLRAGMDGFVTKPIDVTTLKTTIRTVMADTIESIKQFPHDHNRVQELDNENK